LPFEAALPAFRYREPRRVDHGTAYPDQAEVFGLVLSPLGAGGMGEVYRARDTRLERTVAVKVLPSHLSASPEVGQRFEREARTISQLLHQHICALHDIGNQDGQKSGRGSGPSRVHDASSEVHRDAGATSLILSSLPEE